MITKQVPVVVYEKGERKIVGSAVVDMDRNGNQLDMTATITDPQYAYLFGSSSEHFSLQSINLGEH